MKRSFILLAAHLFVCSYAQQVQDTIKVKIPYIGQNGGAYSLGWSLDESKENIYLYTFSHVNGYQVISSEEEMKEGQKKYEDKSWWGKFLENATRGNNYKFAINPIVAETKINISDKKRRHEIQMFHNIDNVPEGKNVYFIGGSSGMVDLGGSSFRAGSMIKDHQKDINKALRYTPKIPNIVLNFLTVAYKGDGILGLKNLRPFVERRKAEFLYDTTKGFHTKTEKIVEIDLQDYIDFKEYSYVEDSYNINKESVVAWFVNKKGEYLYLFYNGKTKEKPELRKYDFDNKREIKVKNQVIYNEDYKAYGFLSVFGYDKKQDKDKKQYAKEEFDIVITDLQGKEISRKTIKWGNSEAYKDILTPMKVFYKDGKLKIMNNHIQTFFKRYYEFLEYDMNTGEIKSHGLQDKDELTQDKAHSFVKNYLYETSADYKMGKNKVFIKTEQESSDSKAVNSPKIDVGFNVLVVDENYKPLGYSIFRDVLPQINGKEKISYQLVLDKENELVVLANQGSSYYLIKVDELGKVSAQRIKTSFETTSENKVYFGYSDLNPALVDVERRKIYIINQYYSQPGYQERILKEVGISVIGF